MTFSRDADPFRVLVVDDNPAIHEDFRKILAQQDASVQTLRDLEAELFGAQNEAPAEGARFEIDAVHQGDQAVALVRESVKQGRPYALAFVDIRMPPGIDGIETIAAMWQIDPSIQAVICTAYSDHTWNEIIKSLGHSDGLLVLRKPFDAIEVLQVAHALGRKWLLSQQVRKRLQDLECLVQERTHELEQTNQRLRREITQRLQAEDSLKHLATHDVLTGLPNRILLNDRLTSAINRAARHRRTIAILLLDLDQFKEVNDSYGHAAGDELLRQVAIRLKGCVRACDTVARMGGDEFVVILEDLAEPEEAAIIAQRILKSCTKSFEVLGNQVRTPPSIGIAAFPADCTDAESLLKSADLAMYEAKNAGRATYRFYSHGMLSSSVEQLGLREQLEQGVLRQEFTLWYQPLLDLRTGAITAMEALVRWQHPSLGLVPPMKFIPMAEKSGLIVPLGRWVLCNACQQLSEWQRGGASDLSIAVNVSPRQLSAPSFVEDVAEALRSADISPSLLELEITETAAMDDMPQSRAALKRLVELGVQISIDDFGSGYSSLMRLKELSIQSLKIDRFFIKDIAEDPRDAAIVKAIVAMAHSMGIKVVAEGVETIEQLRILRTMRWNLESHPMCDKVQGFLLSQPLPADAATSLLRTERDAKVHLVATGT